MSTENSQQMDVPVWGAGAMAPIINRSRRATFHMLETKQLDATKTGKQWVSTPRRLLKSLGVEV
jgi:hypothetical protein